MTIPISLRNVVGVLDTFSDELRAYLNKKTGELASVSIVELSAVEEGEDWSDAPEWQREQYQLAGQILDSDDWLQLPDKFEIHEYAIIEDFCFSLANEDLRDDMLDLIRGSGAFRRFKNAIYRRGIEKDWFDFRCQVFKRIAVDWLERNEIAYVNDFDPKASTESKKEARSHKAVVIGIPSDENSSFLRGAAEAPKHIREAFDSSSTNRSTENGIDLDENTDWQDLGDIALNPGAETFPQIEGKIGELLEDGYRVLSLGGDHAITYPIIRAFAKKYPRLNILHLDAHPDLYDELDGNRHSHACPFARIMEADLAARLVQVGIRTMTPHQRQQAERFGVEVHHLRDWNPSQVLEFSNPLYISLDMDVLDPAFAPGISHYEPGGLSTRAVLDIIQKVKGDIVGADIVELNPTRDLQGVTAMVAAKFYKELLARMIE